MTKYILNSAVITSPGIYEYYYIDIEAAKKWLADGDWISTIGYQETCDCLEMLTGVKVTPNRKQILMQVGDEALVFRLTCRLDNPRLKGSVSKEFILANCEMGMLVKVNT